MSEPKARMSETERRRFRAAMATHVVNGLIIAWGEANPNIEQLSRRAVKITDSVLATLEATEDGDYPHWW